MTKEAQTTKRKIFSWNGEKHRHRFVLAAFLAVLCLFQPAVLWNCTVNRRTIENPEMDDWDYERMRYKNLFPPRYAPKEKTEFDDIDFRLPNEKGTAEYSLVSDPEGDVDRTKGYDPAEHTVIPDLAVIHDPEHEVQITWIRHASFLIQIGGKYQILVDPVMGEIDGMVGRFGKYVAIGRLYADTPLDLEDLPFVSGSEYTSDSERVIVTISHDHYDHLNYNTLTRLPPTTMYYVPHGLEIDFPSQYADVTGMDWYTRDVIGDLTITFLPANHRSGRSMYEMNQSLWGGWLFEWNDQRIYFAGDTGYSPVFKDIRNQVGEMDICLMPISAWFQRHWHFAPEDAIEAAEDLGCRIFIPWGWGTWIMSYEHILDPPRRLQYAWDNMQPQNMELRILKMGETNTMGGSVGEGM